MKVGILALQGDVREHAAALADLDTESRPVRTPSELALVDALILPGGESTTMSLLLGSSGLREPIVERLAEGMPAFGTCAGLILLAQFGAIDIDVQRNGYGRQIDSFEAQIDWDPPLHAIFIRAPVVERVGDGVEVLATIDDRAVLCRQGPVLAAAFHPELTDDRRVHQMFLSIALGAEPLKRTNGAPGDRQSRHALRPAFSTRHHDEAPAARAVPPREGS
jgi:5'-phosphate synthase pdxT subunit